MSQPTISIVGAGIGGLTLGRCLLQRGIRATLYEKASIDPRYGYAITLQPASYRPLLNTLNIDEPVFKSHVAVDAGIGGAGSIANEGYGYRNLEPASFRAHRGKFEEMLREGLDIRWEHAVQGVEEKPDGGLSLRLDNGQILSSDIVVGAEGPHSVIRKQFLPLANPEILPYVAFNGKRRLSRKAFDSVYASIFKNTTVLETRLNNVVLNISINETTSDQVSMSWTYSRPVRGSLDVLHKPNRPNSAAKDIPEEFFQEIGALKELSQPFADIFDVEKLRKERILHWLMRSNLVPRTELEQLGDKGLLLLGDAGHAEQIIGGGGANSAIDDGLNLANWIAEKGVSDVRSWYAERYSGWEDGQEKSRLSIANIHGQQEIGKRQQQHL